MRLDIQIKEAFTGRTMPSHAINPQLDTSFLGPDETDAFWFQGRDWRELTRDDWQRHYCGIFFFTADALAYYLPSIMLHSMGRQSDVFLAADSLVLVLEGRTPVAEKCQHHSCDCLALSSEERGAVVRWMRYLRSTSEFKTGVQRERVDRALAVWTQKSGGPVINSLNHPEP
jgi:hypothetical protein